MSREKRALRKKKHNRQKLMKLHESSKTVLKVWLDVTVTEGKYREVRRALENCGLEIDRLIRTDFGPYSLGNLTPGSALKIRRRKHDENLPSLNMRTISPEAAAASIQSGSY